VVVNKGIVLGAEPDQAQRAQPVASPCRDTRYPARETRFDGVAHGLPPIVAAVIAAVSGFLVVATATIAAGVLLVAVVLHGNVQRADNDAIHWFADHRTSTWTTVSWIGSHLAETATVVIAVGAVTVALVVNRHLELAVFLVAAITVEAATYLVTVQFIDRQRPDVPRLEALNEGASYPSGHTAAAVVLYGGLALVASALGARLAVRRALLVLAFAAPLAVATARMYRGMHHPLDVVSGAVMGCACLAVGVFTAWCFARSGRLRRTVSDRSVS
jgi:undecaprenyl-diphosphatase